jgi:excisionase family DNA binding protein
MAEDDASSWLSLGAARRYLGVNESTLRRWADAGQVRSVRTPGGHRRFARQDVQSLMETRRNAGGANLRELAFERIRARLDRPQEPAEQWYQSMPEERRLRLRPFGRRLLELMPDTIGTGGHMRPEAAQQAREIGRAYGEELSTAGLRLSDTVQAFTFFRRLLDEATAQMARERGFGSEETARAMEQISGLADLVLIAITEAYESRPTAPAGAGGA